MSHYLYGFKPQGPTRCQRCHGETSIHMCSMFNTQQVCMECKRKEEAHPKYQEAREAESHAVRNGNFNYPGIGHPPDLK
jgi:hypothetical protein